MTADSALVTSISLPCAIVSDRGRPRTMREIQAIAPVSRSPATTMYRAAIVITPVLANPCSAFSGSRMPSRVSRIIAPTSTTSVSIRVLVSSTSTPTTTARVMRISTVKGAAASRISLCAVRASAPRHARCRGTAAQSCVPAPGRRRSGRRRSPCCAGCHASSRSPGCGTPATPSTSASTSAPSSAASALSTSARSSRVP